MDEGVAVSCLHWGPGCRSVTGEKGVTGCVACSSITLLDPPKRWLSWSCGAEGWGSMTVFHSSAVSARLLLPVFTTSPVSHFASSHLPSSRGLCLLSWRSTFSFRSLLCSEDNGPDSSPYSTSILVAQGTYGTWVPSIQKPWSYAWPLSLLPHC